MKLIYGYSVGVLIVSLLIKTLADKQIDEKLFLKESRLDVLFWSTLDLISHQNIQML